MANRICELLGIEKPVVSAAMTWITSGDFVASVSAAGGAGVLGINAGYPDHVSAERVSRQHAQMQRVRELTDKPYGVNLMVGPELDKYAQETLQVVLEERPTFVLVLPFSPMNQDAIAQLKDAGIKIVARPISPTLESMQQAAADGADALIYTGNEAGGHASDYDVSLISGFPAMRAAIDLPLMAAGGIVDEASARAAAAMGADGVYVGTRFIVTKENPTSDLAKQAIIDAKAEELIRVPDVPGYSNFVRNAVATELERMYKEGADAIALNAYYMEKGGFQKGMLLGVKDEGIINCSQAINAITGVKTCAEVVEELGRAFA